MPSKKSYVKEVSLSSWPKSLRFVGEELWSCEEHGITVFNRDLKQLRTLPHIQRAWSVASLPDDTVLVAGFNGLQRIKQNGGERVILATGPVWDVAGHTHACFVCPVRAPVLDVYSYTDLMQAVRKEPKKDTHVNEKVYPFPWNFISMLVDVSRLFPDDSEDEADEEDENEAKEEGKSEKKDKAKEKDKKKSTGKAKSKKKKKGKDKEVEQIPRLYVRPTETIDLPPCCDAECLRHTLSVTEGVIKFCCVHKQKLFILPFAAKTITKKGAQPRLDATFGDWIEEPLSPMVGGLHQPYLCVENSLGAVFVDSDSNRVWVRDEEEDWSDRTPEGDLQKPVALAWSESRMYISTLLDEIITMYS